MTLTVVDWAIVFSYFAFSTVIGLLFTKRGGESLDEYFLSGRQVPWWLAGAAMESPAILASLYRRVRPGGPGWETAEVVPAAVD